MIRLTIIARLIDGLPLAASMEDEHDEGGLAEYKSQAKQLFKRLNESSPNRCSIESGSFVFHYAIEYGVCYLTLVDRSYPKRLAFSYLEELQKQFQMEYGGEVGTVARPYAFIKFGK